MSMPPLRIGILDLQTKESTSSGAYSRTIMQSLSSAAEIHPNISVYALATEECKLPNNILRLPEARDGDRSQIRKLKKRIYTSLAVRTGKRFPNVPDSKVWWQAFHQGVDVILPTVYAPSWDCGIPLIGWIPDFQHKHYPDLFSQDECSQRDRNFSSLADQCSRIIVSSQSALSDYLSFEPKNMAKVSVHPFPSAHAFSSPTGDPGRTTAKYNLPTKYILIINQIWSHKNHMVVIKALGRLKKIGCEPTVVMPGLPADYRDPMNSNLSSLFQEASKLDVQSQTIFLGHIPYADLVDLTRSCTLLIQPSLFEGWNTSVQDAKALGKPVICSDIPVHREQAPEALGFFDPHDSNKLAEIIARNWQDLAPGLNEKKELDALNREKMFAAAHGEKLLQLCLSTAADPRF